MYPVCSLCYQCVPSKDLKENSETLNIKRGTNCKKTRSRDPLPCPIRVPYCSWCSQCVPSVISTVRGVPSVYPVCSLCSQCVPSKDFLKENSETLNIKWGTNSKRTRWETLYPAPSYVLSVLSLWSTLLVVFPVCNLCVPHISVLFWVCSQVCSRLCPSTSLQPRD